MTHDELLETINRTARYGLTELNLSGQDLTDLPPEIGQLSQLTILNLENNQLTNLPELIGQLSQLESLNLSNNQSMEHSRRVQYDPSARSQYWI